MNVTLARATVSLEGKYIPLAPGFGVANPLVFPEWGQDFPDITLMHAFGATFSAATAKLTVNLKTMLATTSGSVTKSAHGLAGMDADGVDFDLYSVRMLVIRRAAEAESSNAIEVIGKVSGTPWLQLPVHAGSCHALAFPEGIIEPTLEISSGAGSWSAPAKVEVFLFGDE